jgi:hypothetical protein
MLYNISTMRLIRCTSTDPNGFIDNSFNQDIIITPKSKIALKSLSLETQSGEIIIDQSNDKLTFQVDELQGELNALLEHYSYEPQNSANLLENMTTSINAQFDTSVSSNIGMEAKAFINSKTKCEVSFRRGILQQNDSKLVVNKGTIAVTKVGAAPNTVFSAPSVPTGNNCFVYDPIQMSRGGGVFRIQLNQIGAVNNFTMAVTQKNPDTISGSIFPNNELLYGINCRDSSLSYQFINGGVVDTALNTVIPTYAGVGDSSNDFLEIAIDQGKLIGRIFVTTTNSYITIFEEEYYVPLIVPELYPILVFHSDVTTTSIKDWRYTHSPFLSDTYLTTVPIIEAVLGSTPPDQNANATQHFFQFEGASLSTFLGFSSTRIPRTGTQATNNFTILANTIFRPNNKSDAWIVEMLNIGLMSYDGETSQRKSYLAVIPKEDTNNQVVFSETYPVFIDMNNAEPLSIRNLKLRILNNDGSAVATNGLTTAVLLIQNGEEKPFNILE